MSDVSAKSLPASIELHGVTVHKMLLSETIEFSKHLNNVPKMLEAFQGSDNKDDIVGKLGQLLIDSLPDAHAMIIIATRSTKEEIDKKLDLEKAIDVFLAIFEVNDFFSMLGGIGKKLKAKGFNLPK